MTAVPYDVPLRNLTYRIISNALHFQKTKPPAHMSPLDVALPDAETSASGSSIAPDPLPNLATSLAAHLEDHLRSLYIRCQVADIEFAATVATIALELARTAIADSRQLPRRLATQITGPLDLSLLETATLKIIEAATQLELITDPLSDTAQEQLRLLRTLTREVNQAHPPTAS